MAMTTCPECKKPVSDQAAACPTCGAPIRRSLVRTSVQNNKHPKPARTGSSFSTLMIGGVVLLGFCGYVANKGKRRAVEGDSRQTASPPPPSPSQQPSKSEPARPLSKSEWPICQAMAAQFIKKAMGCGISMGRYTPLSVCTSLKNDPGGFEEEDAVRRITTQLDNQCSGLRAIVSGDRL